MAEFRNSQTIFLWFKVTSFYSNLDEKITSNEQKVTSNEQKVTSSKQKVTSSKQKVTSNKQKGNKQGAKSNEQRATSKKFSLFVYNGLKVNPDKFQFIILGNTGSRTLQIGDINIKSASSFTLL